MNCEILSIDEPAFGVLLIETDEDMRIALCHGRQHDVPAELRDYRPPLTPRNGPQIYCGTEMVIAIVGFRWLFDEQTVRWACATILSSREYGPRVRRYVRRLLKREAAGRPSVN